MAATAPLRIFNPDGRPLRVAVEDPYRGLWYDFTARAFVPRGQLSAAAIGLAPDPDPAYAGLWAVDLPVDASWPDGGYVAYLLDPGPPSRLAAPPLAFAVQGGTTQAGAAALQLIGAANLTFAFPKPPPKDPARPDVVLLPTSATAKFNAKLAGL